MKLTVTIPNGSTSVEVVGTCQMGEFNGDGRFDQPLVGDDTLVRIMQAWAQVDPMERAFFITGEDQHARLIAGFVRHFGDRPGMTLIEVRVDDTTWLHSLDTIRQMLPHPSFHWDIELISAHPAKQVTDVPSLQQAQRAASDALRDDPSFWIDEHSEDL